MSTLVSHTSFEVRQFPEHAVQPAILYLHVGDRVHAAAAQTVAGLWEVVVFGTQDAPITVPDDTAAREYLQQLGQKVSA